MNGKIPIVVGLVWMLLIALTSCNDKKEDEIARFSHIIALTSCNDKKEDEIARFSHTQDTIFKNGTVIITTEVNECTNYDMKDPIIYVHKLIYTNEVRTTMDSLSIYKISEMEKVHDYIDVLILNDYK